MSYGFMGKMLRVDLTSKNITVEKTDEKLFRKYLGGSGYAAYLLYNEFDNSMDPLAPKSPMIWMTGLLTGTIAPTACKLSVCAKSPLTGIWNEATIGGKFGAEFKFAGYDGMIITGKANEPVYLWISGDDIQIKPAKSLWGKTTYDTYNALAEEYPKVQTACIGPAGETLSRISGIMSDGELHNRAAARGGIGAVMGSKNLKAVVVKGVTKPRVAHLNEFRTLVKEANKFLKENGVGMTNYGTAGGVLGVHSNGDLPIKNWALGTWEEGAAKTCGQAMAERFEIKHHACFACPIRCAKSVKVLDGPYAGLEVPQPEYETTAGFGANLLNDDPAVIAKANHLCNEYGLDTISACNTIAFAIELYEKGIINKENTDGLELKWGDRESIIRTLEKMCKREGYLGNLLADGSKYAAEQIGRNAMEFAIHVKGMEFALHDPRAFTSMAVNYATANRGACHLEALTYFAEPGGTLFKEFGYNKENNPFHFGSDEGKAELCAKYQNYMNTFNALGLCKFAYRGGLNPEYVLNLTKLATGWDDFTMDEMIEVGERLFNLKRAYNVKLGISRKDDKLPPRLFTWSRKTGRNGDVLANLGKLLGQYYEFRGWSEYGVPTPNKLRELGLDEAVNDMW